MRPYALPQPASLRHPRLMFTFKSVLRQCFITGVVLMNLVPLHAQAPAAATQAFNNYAATVEKQLVDSAARPMTLNPLLKSGQMLITDRTPAGLAAFNGALFRHWQGEIYLPGAKAGDFLRLMKDYGNYPRIFPGEVERVTVNSASGGSYSITMRTRQQYVITVVMDSSFAIDFHEITPQQGFSISRSTAVREIDSPGTKSEHALDAAHEHGFLWRLNTYWSWRETDGGLYLRIETLSLSRAIPTGLGWAVGPFVDRVPRNSLEFTLRSVSDALRKKKW